MKLVMLTVPILAALALAACGADGTSSDGAGGRPDDKAELAFARCMRSNGIDLPDPGTGAAGERRVQIGKGTAPQKLRAATESCRKKTGGGPKPLTEEQQAEFRDAALKFAQCMRRNGVDLPDPQTSSSGGDFAIRVGPGKGKGPNIDSAAFKRAQEACQKLLPGKRGGGGFAFSARGN